MSSRHRALNRVTTRRAWLDRARKLLIIAIWGGLSNLIFDASMVWGFIWLIPGLFLVMNIVGFATLPLYIWALAGPTREVFAGLSEDADIDE